MYTKFGSNALNELTEGLERRGSGHVLDRVTSADRKLITPESILTLNNFIEQIMYTQF